MGSEKTEALSASALAKIYPGATGPALDGFDISIEPGAFFGLLGPNGAGKTTAISILCTLMTPTSGNVRIFGTNALKSPKNVRTMIGLVPQDIAVYEDLTARENLNYFGRLYGLHGRTLKDRISECLDFVGLSEKADDRVRKYSGGMKRRVNLAAGILNHPRLLFLDEPTVGIDAQSRNMILEKLANLNQAGTTMLYTTHYMEEAEQLCSQIAILDEGRIITQGPVPGLIRDHSDCKNLGDLFLKLTGKRLRD